MEQRFRTYSPIVLATALTAFACGPEEDSVSPTQAPVTAAATTYTGVTSRLHNFSKITSTIAEHDAHPELKLVSAMATWALLEPSDGTFDWTQMNANVEHARTNGYKIIFRIMAGRNVPDWLYARGASSITVRGTDKFAHDLCHDLRLPIPWDPVLKSEYEGLMTELGRWMSEPDGAGKTKGDHIYFVPVAMPTFQGTEMVLGYGMKAICPDGADLVAWNRARWDAISTDTGRRALTEQAWKDAIDLHMMRLPASVDSAIAYGHLFSDAQAAALRIAREKVAQYPTRLISMLTNLQPKVRTDGTLGPWREWCGRCDEVLVTAQDAGGAVGFQMASTAINNTAEKFRTAVEDGLATYKMQFLEPQPTAVQERMAAQYADSEAPTTPRSGR